MTSEDKPMVLDARKDPMGWAIADYYKNGVAGRLRVFSSMFDEDEMSHCSGHLNKCPR